MSKEIKYKHTGIPYCPQIPESWNVKRLKFVGKSIIGITYNPTQVTDEENGKLVLRSSNVQNGQLSFEDNVYVDAEISEKHLTKEGDILICARNGSAHLVGKCAYIPKDYEGLTFGAFMLMFRSEFGKFMYYVFNSNLFKSQTGLYKTSTINQLTSDTINNLFVALPSNKQEQEKIVHFLDLKTSEIELIISKKQKLIDCLKDERVALINHAVTKGINPSAVMKDSGIDWIGEIPESWEVKKLKYVAKMIGGFAFSSNDFSAEGVQLIKIANLYQNELCLERQPTFVPFEYLQLYSKWKVTKGDILISMTGTLGKRDYGFAIILDTDAEYLLNQRVGKIEFDGDKLNNELGLHLIRSNYYLDQLFLKPTGSKQGNLSNEDILSIEIAFPVDITEQINIANSINKLIQDSENVINKIQQEIELIKEYRASLINELVTGKILLN